MNTGSLRIQNPVNSAETAQRACPQHRLPRPPQGLRTGGRRNRTHRCSRQRRDRECFAAEIATPPGQRPSTARKSVSGRACPAQGNTCLFSLVPNQSDEEPATPPESRPIGVQKPYASNELLHSDLHLRPQRLQLRRPPRRWLPDLHRGYERQQQQHDGDDLHRVDRAGCDHYGHTPPGSVRRLATALRNQREAPACSKSCN